MAITTLEQKFMDQVPHLLRDISESLKAIAGNGQAKEPAGIWVLFSESLYDYELMSRDIQVFTGEAEAREAFKAAVADARSAANENNWTIGTDNDYFFEAYPDGSWGTSHETVELQQTMLNGNLPDGKVWLSL